MIATANGRTILSADIYVPRRGAWHARVSVEAEDTSSLTESVDLAFDGITWSGFVRAGDVSHGRVELSVVGGAGGLKLELEPRYYVDAQARIPLDDLMRETGETLSSDVGPDVTDVTLARWTRARGRGGALLSDVAATLGVTWRVLPDGTVWLGTETWPDVELEYDVIASAPADDFHELAVDAPTLTAGVTLGERRISYVQHVIAPARTRSMVWYEAEG